MEKLRLKSYPRYNTMNGLGRKGLKLGYALFLVMYILFILLFVVIFALCKMNPDNYNGYKTLYPALAAGVVGIIIAVFAKLGLDKYQKGSRTSPLWLFSLMSAMAMEFPAGLIIMIEGDDFKFKMIFESFYTIFLFAFIVIAIYLLLSNIFKSKILISLGCVLMTVALVTGVIWQIKNVVFNAEYHFDYMLPQIMKPYTYICVLVFFEMAITTFIMSFSIFTKVNKTRKMTEAEAEQALYMALTAAYFAHEKGILNDEELKEIEADFSEEDKFHAREAMFDKKIRRAADKMLSDPNLKKEMEKVRQERKENNSENKSPDPDEEDLLG